ncbi:DUF4386 family protein [Rubrobacter marinus]|uniref:DUF4386 family protein n=1 Tax=Rubrobacter marinus TaxID=2653852 RepID=A0A6G8PW62_9ACTN|nr:DUF4386 family protein [Rubrobacter marinus]QIN78448.1 DUF4386 family protein [Rubrobacter marinus]
MLLRRRSRVVRTEAADTSPKVLYKTGGTAALTSVLLVLLDILVSAVLPRGEVQPGAQSAVDWFALFRDDVYYAFRDLGLLNVLNLILGIPIFLALYAVHRRIDEALAALALVLFLFGGAVYVSNNAAVPMFVLSGEHTAASTEAERAALAAAGEAILARGADFTPGSLVGFVLPSVAQIAISLVMLRGGAFGRPTAYFGILGFSLLLAFTVWTTLVPDALGVAMLLAVPGGLLVVAWNVLVARKLFRLARASGKQQEA